MHVRQESCYARCAARNLFRLVLGLHTDWAIAGGAAVSSQGFCTCGSKLAALPGSHHALPLMSGRTSLVDPLPSSCAVACVLYGTVICRFEGTALCLLRSASRPVGESVVGLKTPFAKVAGSSALLAGKLGPAHAHPFET